MADLKHHAALATSRTMPRHIWMHEVALAAGRMVKCDLDDADRYCGRERLNRWYNDEMPVWIAADSLASFVKLGKREEAKDRRDDGYRQVLRDAVKRSR